MRREPIDQLRTLARVTEAAPPPGRRARLRRWAALLAEAGPRKLNALMWLEYHAGQPRARIRRRNSPLEIAYADPVLRSWGLEGDSLGEIQAFFQLSDDEVHETLCDCRYAGRMTGSGASKRIGALARPGIAGRISRWLAR